MILLDTQQNIFQHFQTTQSGRLRMELVIQVILVEQHYQSLPRHSDAYFKLFVYAFQLELTLPILLTCRLRSYRAFALTDHYDLHD